MRIPPLALGVSLTAALAAACGTTGDSTFPATENPTVDGGAGPPSSTPEFDESVVPSSRDPFEACATAEGEALASPVYLLVVLDGSRSMAQNPDGSASPKWAAARDALDSAFESFASRSDPSFGVGLTVFCDANDTTCRDDPTDSRISWAGPYDDPDVPIRAVDAEHRSALRRRIVETQPNHGTPTYEVLDGQLRVLDAFEPAPPLRPGGRKVLVFISDGVPDEDMPKGREDPSDTDGEAKASKAIVASMSRAVTTFSVGVGELSPLVTSIYDPRFMADLALAGGAAKEGCSPDEIADEAKMCHFQITPGQKDARELTAEFERALESIRTTVAPCEYELQRTGEESMDTSNVNVVFTDGRGEKSVVHKSDADGWSFDDPRTPTRVHLHGEACARVKADRGGKVTVVLGCKTVIR